MKTIINKLKYKIGSKPEFIYEFPFKSPEMMTEYNNNEWPPQKPTYEMEEWLKTCEGEWQYIIEMGCLWGIGFSHEEDAAAFKLKWM